MDYPDDAGLRAALTKLRIPASDLLGHGGEAWVYAFGRDTVVRVLHDGATAEGLTDQHALVAELRSDGAPFLLPEVLEVREVEGRLVVVERRLPGRSVLGQLAVVEGEERRTLVEHHLATSAALGRLHLERRGWYGELLGREPVRAPTWNEFLRQRAAKSLRAAGPAFVHMDAERTAAALSADLPECAEPAFVHLDAFAGNMLAEGSSVTAVIDVSVTSLSGDARLDPVAAAVYLSAPEITPTATPEDADVAASWLRSAGLADLFAPVRRWLAAYWSFAVDDTKLHAWCRSVLPAIAMILLAGACTNDSDGGADRPTAAATTTAQPRTTSTATSTSTTSAGAVRNPAPAALISRWESDGVELTINSTTYRVVRGPNTAEGSIAVRGSEIDFFDATVCKERATYTWTLTNDALRLDAKATDPCPGRAAVLDGKTYTQAQE